MGELWGARSPAASYSPLVGAEIRIQAGTTVTIPVRPDFEHGVVVVSGRVTTTEQVPERAIDIIEAGPDAITVTAETDAIVLLLGGAPFGEKILMWWNFIGRTHTEIVEARQQWNARSERFGEFEDHIGGWIPAPDMPSVVLTPR